MQWIQETYVQFKQKKTMKKLLYFLAIAVLAIAVQSCDGPNLDQRTFVHGIVTDAETSEPIKGCEIYLSRHTPAEHSDSRASSPVGPSVTVTNEAGYYEFTHLYFGTYNIDAVLAGYKTYSVKNLLMMEEATEVNIALEKGE